MKHYKIAELLANGEQWFGQLDDETFESLKRHIGNGDDGLTVPIVLSPSGRLLDGHHRLMALQAAGRKTISEADVRIDSTAVDAESEAMASIRYQFTRRQIGTPEKARLARALMRRFGWSQGLIAQHLGVTQPAVSHWLRLNPDDTFEAPTTVVGRDGNVYPVEQDDEPKAKRPKANYNAPNHAVETYSLQLANPGWGQWIKGWAVDADADERTDVTTNLRLIGEAMLALAEDVEAIAAADSRKPF